MSKIVVHGIHRSGTSFWASLFEKAGCWYAEDEYKMASQADNPRGFWERTDVVDLTTGCYRALGLIGFHLFRVFKNKILPIYLRLSKQKSKP